MRLPLCPTQREALESARRYTRPGRIVAIGGKPGSGKSRVLRALAEESNGEALTMRHFMEWQRDAHPLRLEETLEWLLSHHLAQADEVFLDDLDRLLAVMRSDDYPRLEYVNAALAEIPRVIADEGRTLVCVCATKLPTPFRSAVRVTIGNFTDRDYHAILETLLQSASDTIDERLLFNANDSLDGYLLTALAHRLLSDDAINTEVAIQLVKEADDL